MTTLPQTTIRLPRSPAASASVVPVVPGHVGAPPPVVSGMTANDAWRVIRANLWLIVTMLLVSLVIGYAVNTVLLRYVPRYSAAGQVSIHAPTSYNFQTRTNEPVSDFPGLAVEQRTQAMLIHNESLFTRVLQNSGSTIRNTSWYHSFEVPLRQADGSTRAVFDLASAKKSLSDNFIASPVEGTNLVNIMMTFSNGRDACEIVKAIVEQHLNNQDDLITGRELDKQNLLSNARDTQKTRIKELLDKIHSRALELNIEDAGNSAKLSSRQMELDKLTAQRFDLQSRLTLCKAKLESILDQVSKGQTLQDVENEVERDQEVSEYRKAVDEADVQIKLLYSARDDNPRMKELQTSKDVYSQKLEQVKEIKRGVIRNKMLDDLRSEQAVDAQQIDSLDKRIDAARDQLAQLANAMNDYASANDELARLRDEAAQTQQQLDAITVQIQQTSHGVMWAEKPIVPDLPSFPRLGVTMTASVMIGLAIALGIAFLRELMDTSVRSPRDISRVGNLNLLGMIPHEDDDPQSHGVALPFVIFQAPTSIMAEGFRQVRTRLQHAASLDTTRTILVTSPSPGDGKSVVAANLACGLALNGRRILLIDANFRRPMLDKEFSIDNAVGLSDVLSGGLDRFDSATHRSIVPNLDVMPTGPRPASATELLEGNALLEFIDRALEDYDHLIFDSGPMLLVSETAALAPRVDGVVTVVRARANSRGLLQRLRDNLRQLKAEHLGVVLNAVRSQGGGYYGRNIKTYYEYQNAG